MDAVAVLLVMLLAWYCHLRIDVFACTTCMMAAGDSLGAATQQLAGMALDEAGGSTETVAGVAQLALLNTRARYVVRAQLPALCGLISCTDRPAEHLLHHTTCR